MTVSYTTLTSNADYLRLEAARVLASLARLLGTTRPEPLTLPGGDAVIEARRRAVAAGVAIPFEGLTRRFGLSWADEEVLWVCLAAQLSTRVGQALMAAQGQTAPSGVQVGFLSELAAVGGDLVSDMRWSFPGSPLMRNGLLVGEAPAPGASRSWPDRAVYAPGYLMMAVQGSRGVDARVAEACELVVPGHALFDVVLPAAAAKAVEGFMSGFRRGPRLVTGGLRPWTLLLSGPAGSGKSHLAEGLAHAMERQILRVDARRVSDSAHADLVAFHARFHETVLHVLVPDHLPTGGELLERLIARHHGVTILEARETRQISPRLAGRIDFGIALTPPDVHARTQIWEGRLPAELSVEADVDLASLAAQYELSGAQISTAATWAQQVAVAQGRDRVGQHDLALAARGQLGARVGSPMKQERCGLTLADLVLDDTTMARIVEVRDACRARGQVLHQWGFAERLASGRGIAALLHGKPGTGKTQCARILAAELDMELLVVSIPDVVSKWVGETEKHLRDLFSEARARNSLLLFDEADALFGTRVKVEKAQDQYANLQVDTLLQEIEAYDGIVILTTNLEANLDKAFARRILFNIEFTEPTPEQRARIWQGLLPAEAPREEDLDFDQLGASFELSGGQIKNALLRAAYRSSAGGRGLGMTELLDAARDEAKAAGKLIRLTATSTR
jgi:SpoVK/Ycf46/Vps4 family AAA+-type ATPase